MKNKTVLGGAFTILMMFGVLYTGTDKFSKLYNHSWDVYKYVKHSESLEDRELFNLNERTVALEISVLDPNFKNEDNPFGFF